MGGGLERSGDQDREVALDFSWSVKLELLWIVSLNQEVRGTTLVCHMGRSFPSLHSGVNPVILSRDFCP